MIQEMPQYDIIEGNQYNHINNFKSKLSLYEDEHPYYKLFPATFQGEAITWYARLPPMNINS